MAAKVKQAQEPSSPHSIGVTDINVIETTFTWVVKNFSFCPKGFGDKLNSPVFETTNNKNITWCINLDPNSSKNFSNFIFSLKLVKSDRSKIDASFEFSIINKNGAPEKRISCQKSTFFKGSCKSLKILMNKSYLVKNAQQILPNDTLTVLCKIKANLDQGVTNSMKVKAVSKQKSEAQVLSDQAGAVPPTMKTKTGPKQKIQAQTQLNNLTAATAKMKIEDSPKASSKSQAYLEQAGAAATGTVKNTKKVAEPKQMNSAIYPPVNTAYAYTMVPPLGKPAVTSTASQYMPNFVSSGSTTAQSANFSTLSTFGVAPQLQNYIYCRFCNYFLHNCICKNYCNYCKRHLQYCKCVYCEYCEDHLEDCECEHCPYCDLHIEECVCDICEYCDSHMQDCECEHCAYCDCHIEECDCDDNYCSYCDSHLEDCECDYCPDCDCHIEECECHEYGNNYYYY